VHHAQLLDGWRRRFVSGYLIALSPDVKALDGPSGVEEDLTNFHAWWQFVARCGHSPRN
jgi:hypothetical protein